MQKIVQIMPAVDWHFKHDQTVWNVAELAFTDDRATIGLIGAGNDGALKTVPTRTKSISTAAS